MVLNLTENEAIQRIINIARLELQYHEKSSNKDLKQRSTQKITTDLNQESTQSTIKATSTNQIINP